jgi:hypothetical protein
MKTWYYMTGIFLLATNTYLGCTLGDCEGLLVGVAEGLLEGAAKEQSYDTISW